MIGVSILFGRLDRSSENERIDLNRLRACWVPLEVLPAMVCIVVELANLKCSMQTVQCKAMLNDVATA